MKKLLSIAFASCALLVWTACGGGSSSPPVSTPPPPPVITITPNPLPEGIAGTPYSVTLTTTVGTGPYTWSLNDPLDLPQGFTFSAAGVLSGNLPADSAGFSVPLQFAVGDTVGHSATANMTLNVMGLSEYVNPAPQVNVVSYAMFTVAGATAPFQWSASGNPPPGMTFQADPDFASKYELMGTPTTAGHFTFTVQVTDSSASRYTVSHDYAVDVEPAPLVLSNAIPTPAVVGHAYRYQFGLQGGLPPYRWSVNGGSLPAGFTLDPATGVLSGTAANPNFASFSIHVTDSSTPGQQYANGNFWLLATQNPLPPRNDTIATATPIVPGAYTASISPLGDPAGTYAPDQDYYVMAVAAGAKYRIGASTYFFAGSSTLDPVIEIVDANGRRFASCNDPFLDNVPAGVPVTKNSAPDFTDPCMNHLDPTNSLPGASLEFMAPGSSGNVTFYIHVFDFRGDARPDMQYTLYVSSE